MGSLREKYLLKGFNKDKVNEGYKKIEETFCTNLGNLEPSIFYKSAIINGEKVERIPRWVKKTIKAFKIDVQQQRYL